MKIYGLQKMTLLDYPGHLACTVFTGGCNMRCPFCHNYEIASGKAGPIMTQEDFFDFLRTRKGRLDGVAISGGEPTIWNYSDELIAFVKRIKGMGFKVKLDTNGTRPEIVHKLAGARLVDYIAMDVKNSADRYAETVGIPNFDITPIKESIRILNKGLVDWEFRTTVVEQLHDDDSIRGIGKLIHGARKFFLQPFADRDTVPYGNFTAPSEETLRRYAKIVANDAFEVEIRGL